MLDSIIELTDDQNPSAINQCNRIIELLFEYTETKANIIAFIFHSEHNEFITNEIPIFSAEPFNKMRAIVERGIKQDELRNYNSWVAVGGKHKHFWWCDTYDSFASGRCY